MVGVWAWVVNLGPQCTDRERRDTVGADPCVRPGREWCREGVLDFRFWILPFATHGLRPTFFPFRFSFFKCAPMCLPWRGVTGSCGWIV